MSEPLSEACDEPVEYVEGRILLRLSFGEQVAE